MKFIFRLTLANRFFDMINNLPPSLPLAEWQRHKRRDRAERKHVLVAERALRVRDGQRKVVVGLLPRVLLLPAVN
jgi:hypothetical protein